MEQDDINRGRMLSKRIKDLILIRERLKGGEVTSYSELRDLVEDVKFMYSHIENLHLYDRKGYFTALYETALDQVQEVYTLLSEKLKERRPVEEKQIREVDEGAGGVKTLAVEDQQDEDEDEEEYRRLIAEVEFLTDAIEKISEMASDQRETLVRIYRNVEEAEENIDRGNKNLVGALASKWGLAIPVTCGILGGLLGGAGGAYLGSELGFWIGAALGGGSGAYTALKSQGKKKNEVVKGFEEELEQNSTKKE